MANYVLNSNNNILIKPLKLKPQTLTSSPSPPLQHPRVSFPFPLLMDNKLSCAPKDALVEIVKVAQKRKMKGDQGEWKEFLSVNDNKFGASMSDPSKRTPEVLLKFLRSFKEVEDLNYFNKVLKCHLNRELSKQLGHVQDAECPEQRLVRLTLEHPMYPIDYSFPSHEEGWVITKLKKVSKLVKSNLVLAVDCEMGLCDDGTEALIKICVVDRNLQVKLHEFVKPNRKVVDYRTEITGVSAEDLEEVTNTLEDIQESLKTLLSRTAILVGHGLSNDLKVLKIDHARVIDTSYIFKCGDKSARRKPSLNGLCKSLLGYELRKKGAPHNCFDDACAAMKLVVTKLEKGFDDVVPTEARDIIEVPDNKRAKLFLHRIPVSMPCDELHQYVPGDFTIEVQTSKKGRGDKYSAFAIFGSPEDALEAYDKLQGDETTDSSGLPQKPISIKLKSGSTDIIYARKMSDDISGSISTKRPYTADATPNGSKKLKEKTSEKSEENQSIDNGKEIERLKEELRQKDSEVSGLHKIIAALTRKQGL